MALRDQMLRVRVSDMNPGNPVPFDIGGNSMYYGGIEKDLYESSTWDIFGRDLPRDVSGVSGNLYVPSSAGSAFPPYGYPLGDQDPYRPPYSGDGYRASDVPVSVTAGRPPRTRPTFAHGVYPPGVGNVEGFRMPDPPGQGPALMDIAIPPASETQIEETPKPRKRKEKFTQAELTDELLLAEDQKANYKLKNPLLVFFFLALVYAAFAFLIEGADGFISKKFFGGSPISWGWYLILGGVISVGLYILAKVFNISFLQVEKL